MEIIERAKAKTPKFFKKVRKIGLVLAAIGTGIVGAPVALPATIIGIGGYLILGGSIAAGVAQLAKED